MFNEHTEVARGINFPFVLDFDGAISAAFSTETRCRGEGDSFWRWAAVVWNRRAGAVLARVGGPWRASRQAALSILAIAGL